MIRVRQADSNDINSILQLRYAAVDNKLRQPITYEMIYNCLQKNCQAWVAVDDDVVVGFSLANKKNKLIWGLFVLPSYQGLGLGKKLLQEAMLWLAESAKWFGLFKLGNIYIETEEGSSAEGFYQKMGWQKGKKLTNREIQYWYPLAKVPAASTQIKSS